MTAGQLLRPPVSAPHQQARSYSQRQDGGGRTAMAEEFLADTTLSLFEQMRSAAPLSDTHRHSLIDIANGIAQMHSEIANDIERLGR